MTRRMTIAGTGYRAVELYGHMLMSPEASGLVELVGLFDHNALRANAARQVLGEKANQIPVYTDFARMIQETHCDTVIVTTKDATHDQFIVAALEMGCDVISEKPLTTDATRLERILRAEQRTGHHVTVTFNYRYAPYATAVRQFLQEGHLGELTSVEFQWYLDTVHGADYFRRWHRRQENSGSLWVHKATHHFDLVNWWTGQDPEEVFARGSRRVYGEQGRAHGDRCSTCAVADSCAYAFDWSDPLLTPLYREAETADEYWRDGCVFAPDVDIWDTMMASVQYSGGVFMNYSLHAYMPFEGYRIAFNGTQGRLECQVIEETLAAYTPNFAQRAHSRQSLDPADLATDHQDVLTADTLRFYPLFGGVETVTVPRALSDHGGGDALLVQALLHPEAPDPWGLQAGTRAGAYSILTGIAARESIGQKQVVRLKDLVAPGLLD